MIEELTDRFWLQIQDGALDVAAASDFLRVEEAGAVDIFLGTTRRWTEGRETIELAYEAYGVMALAEMRRILQQAESRWPICRACLLHRTGDVPLREVSVVIGVATPHRSEAFDAARFLIDTLKERVPIWKREHYADGSTEWAEGQLPSST